MTVTASPAPGTSVPGAPPGLRRSLTPADGDPVPEKPASQSREQRRSAGEAPRRDDQPVAPRLGYLLGLALAAAAAALEIDTRRHRRRTD